MSLLLSLALLVLQSATADATVPFRMHVVGQRHEKVEKVWVHIPASKSELLLYPDNEGIVSISNLPVGTFQVRLSALGYQTWHANLQVTGKQERPLVVTLKYGVLGCSPHYYVEYSNEPGRVVSGVVGDDTDRKLRGIRLAWQRPREKKPFLTLFSNKRGEFAVPQIAPGDYKVVVQDGEFSQNYAEEDKKYKPVSIEVVIPKEDVPFVTIILQRKGWIEVCL